MKHFCWGEEKFIFGQQLDFILESKVFRGLILNTQNTKIALLVSLYTQSLILTSKTRHLSQQHRRQNYIQYLGFS